MSSDDTNELRKALDADDLREFSFRSKIVKVASPNLGLVFGWGAICKERGEEYFDLHADAADEEALIKAARDFMKWSRSANEMHVEDKGTVVFAFPMTAEIAKAYGFDTGGKTGLIIGVEPGPEVYAKFRSGEYTGFSIGGRVAEGGSDFIDLG